MEIRTQKKKERVSVSLDNFGDGRGDVVVILHVPDTDKSEHSHIEIDTPAAIRLRNFLNQYISGEISTEDEEE